MKDGLYFLIGYFPDDLSRYPQNQGTVWDLSAFQNDRPGPDDALVPHLGPGKNDGTHADEAAVPNFASVNAGLVPHNTILPDDRRVAGIGMENAPVLDVGAAADLNGGHVPSQYPRGPNTED